MKHNIEWKSKGRKREQQHSGIWCCEMFFSSTWLSSLTRYMSPHSPQPWCCWSFLWHVNSVGVCYRSKVAASFHPHSLFLWNGTAWADMSNSARTKVNFSQYAKSPCSQYKSLQKKLKSVSYWAEEEPAKPWETERESEKIGKKLISSWEDEPNWTKCSSVPQWDFFFVLFKFPFVMLTVEIEIYSVKNLFLIFFTLTFLFYFYLLKIPSVFCMCIVGGEEEIEQREQRKDQDNTLKFSYRMWRDVRYKRFKKMKMKIPLTSHDESESEVRCNLGGWR